MKSKPAIADRLRVQDIEGGFPHSEIFGSRSVRNSPKLIAAYHVLHRLLAPRHPPNALISLNHSHYRCPPARRGWAPVRPDHLRSDRKDQLASEFDPTPARSRWQLSAQACPRAHKVKIEFALYDVRQHARCPMAVVRNPCFYPDGNGMAQTDGGARRIRTDDILLAKQALYQLSYGPILVER